METKKKTENNQGLTVKETDNSKAILLTAELMGFPEIDLKNRKEVSQRLNDFFLLFAKYDLKPTVSGMAAALNGHKRHWLWAIANDRAIGGRGQTADLPAEVIAVIKKYYFSLENLWEMYMLSDMIKPAVGVFFGKNNFGYREQVECSLIPELPQEKDFSVEEIRKRYLFDEEE